MIKEIKNAKISKTSYNLEQEIKEQERELNALKKVYELNDINALNVLPLKNFPKTKKNSVRIPKKLNDEEKERRKELKKLKEVEELNRIQMTLFKDIKSQRKNYKLNPISQRTNSFGKKYYQTEDFFADNLNKECDKILGDNKKTKNKKYNPIKTVRESDWRKGTSNKAKITKNKIMSSRFTFYKDYQNEMKDIKKIINNNNEINSDEEKDKEFLEKLDNNLKIFYMTKTRQIFDFLNKINLCRYIQYFLDQGYDLFEEFLELPSDFFNKMQNPFLDIKQREKLFQNLSAYKNKKNNSNTNSKKLIISNKENKKEENYEINKENIKTKTKNETGCGTNTVIINKEIPKIKIDNSCNYSVNNSLILNPDEVICCWNCLKPLKKDNSIMKEYNINNLSVDDSDIFKYKHFCNEKCLKDFETEKANKNLNKTDIKNELLYNEKDRKDENIIENEINNNSNNSNKEEEFFEGDNYDPMDDF